MKWEKTKDDGKTRIYMQEKTGTECRTDLIYEDANGHKWWGFYNLHNIPVLRKMQAESVTNLFQIGLTKADISEWITRSKTIIRSSSPEKYEELYALILEKEKQVSVLADPLKMYLGVATLYVLADDERIDYFTMENTDTKMKMWAEDPLASAFFLNWVSSLTQRYYEALNKVSQIVSTKEEDLSI